MRISDWSSDVCSSDLRSRRTASVLESSPPSSRRVLHSWQWSACLGSTGAKHDGQYSKARCPRAKNVTEESSKSDSDCLRRSEEHTSELQSLMRISYAVFCLKKKKQTNKI